MTYEPKYKVGDHVHIVDPMGHGPFVIGQGTVEHVARNNMGEYRVSGKCLSENNLRPLGTIVGEMVSTESGLTGEVLRYTHATDSVRIRTGPDDYDPKDGTRTTPFAEFHRSFIRPVSTAAPEPKTEPSLRDRLAECFRDYAKQAVDAHQWEAATAYLRAANIAEAFGLTPKDPKR